MHKALPQIPTGVRPLWMNSTKTLAAATMPRPVLPPACRLVPNRPPHPLRRPSIRTAGAAPPLRAAPPGRAGAAVTTRPCAKAPLPTFEKLNIDQPRGRACVACGRPIGPGAVYRGPVVGYDGGLPQDADVWACGPPGRRGKDAFNPPGRPLAEHGPAEATSQPSRRRRRPANSAHLGADTLRVFAAYGAREHEDLPRVRRNRFEGAARLASVKSSRGQAWAVPYQLLRGSLAGRSPAVRLRKCSCMQPNENGYLS